MAYGIARATYSYAPGVLVAHDDFAGTTAGVALNGRVAPAGGAWATSGAATDFTTEDQPLAGDETILRYTTGSESGPRFATLGAASHTDNEVTVDIWSDQSLARQGAMTRYVDASNYLTAYVTNKTFNVAKVVAGVETVLSTAYYVYRPNTWDTCRLVVFASGRFVARLLNAVGGILAELHGQDSALAAGGALATGKAGFLDRNETSMVIKRFYDNFYVATPAAEPVVCHAGRSIEFSSTGVQRQDATGTYWGPVPEYVGSRFFIPPSGDKNRKTRVAVIARRNDVTTAPDDHINDPITVQVFVTPRYLVIPRG